MKGLFVILNDGETYTSLSGCVIYDADTGKLYSIRKRRELLNNAINACYKWKKGIAEILDTDDYKIEKQDNKVLGI